MDEQDTRRELERRLQHAEDALRSTRDRLRVVYDHAPDPIVEVDPDGRITALNQTAVQSFGGTTDGWVGRELGELIADGAGRSWAGPESHDREVRWLDGRTMLLRSVPRADGLPGAVVSLRDVTERTAMRNEVEAARRIAAVARVSGGIAHEINNPLTVLQLRTDLLLEERSLPEVLRRQLNVLRESIARIARTVRTLQRVGRPTLTTSEWVGVGDLLEAATLASRSWPGQPAITIEPPAETLGVRGDRMALALAVEQMVTHATEAGGGTARVSLAESTGRVRIELWVLHATFADGLVQDPGSTPDPEGRFPGIGLTVAAGIARDHGGELSTGKDPVRGGFVRLELPLATLDRSVPGPSPSRVLVVDDEPLIAHVLKDWGRRAGHSVEVVRTAELARGMIERDVPFDVILCDDRLPGSSGRDLLAWLRSAHPAFARRFALMSGAPVELGEVRFLPKPFTRRQLAELMNALLQDR